MGAYDKKDFESQIKIDDTKVTVVNGLEAMEIFSKKNENKQVVKNINVGEDKSEPSNNTNILGITKKKIREEDKNKSILGRQLNELQSKPIEEGKAYLVSLENTRILGLSLVGIYLDKSITLTPIGFTSKYELCLQTDLVVEPMIAGNCRAYKCDGIWYIFISVESFKKNEPIKFYLNDEEYLFGFREVNEILEGVYPYTAKVTPLVFMKIG